MNTTTEIGKRYRLDMPAYRAYFGERYHHSTLLTAADVFTVTDVNVGVDGTPGANVECDGVVAWLPLRFLIPLAVQP